MPTHIATGHSVYGPTGDPTSQLDIWGGSGRPNRNHFTSRQKAIPGSYDYINVADAIRLGLVGQTRPLLQIVQQRGNSWTTSWSLQFCLIRQ
jgi:hypothetical protein